jgi:hypothetical protein
LKSLPKKYEKVFTSYTLDKELITRLYRELKILNPSKLNDPMKEGANEQNRAFSKEKAKKTKKHMEKYSLSWP